MNRLKLYSFTCRLLSFKVNNFNRNFVSRTKSFYDVLGITPKATASDIKTAYYKLSMTYHPDKNKSDDSAAEKFRNVTEAYEVLGNYRLRKLYDKGITHQSTGRNYTEPAYEEPEETDPTTKFYKARMNKEKATATGRTPIYDFDEWTESHYGKNFKKTQDIKKRYEEKIRKMESNKMGFQNELILMAVFTFALVMISMSESNKDVDNTKKNKNPDKSEGS